MLENIYSAGLRLLEPLTIDKTYETIINEALRLTRNQFGSIFIEKNGTLQRKYSTTPHVYRMTPRSEGYTQKAYHSGRTIVMNREMIDSAHPEQPKKPYSIIIVPLFYNRQPTGALTLISVKKYIISKKKLNALNLYGSIASLAIKKSQLYSEVEHALKTRDLFISLAGHELRTPLTVAKTFAQLIRRKVKKGDLPPIDWIDKLEKAADRLASLTDEFLRTDNIRRGKLQYHFDNHSLLSVLKAAVANVQIVYPQHSFVLVNNEKNDSVIVNVDYGKLLEAIINLLANASKFSPLGSTVKIQLSKSNKQYTITISDEGKGISRTELPRIFDPFYKAHNQTQGIGLGLYLVKEIISKHQGKIDVTSQLGKGTSISIRLPKERNAL